MDRQRRSYIDTCAEEYVGCAMKEQEGLSMNDEGSPYAKDLPFRPKLALCHATLFVACRMVVVVGCLQSVKTCKLCSLKDFSA